MIVMNYLHSGLSYQVTLFEMQFSTYSHGALLSRAHRMITERAKGHSFFHLIMVPSKVFCQYAKVKVLFLLTRCEACPFFSPLSFFVIPTFKSH